MRRFVLRLAIVLGLVYLWLVVGTASAQQYVVPVIPVQPAPVVIPAVPVVPAVPVAAPIWGFARGPLGFWRLRRVYPAAVAVPVVPACAPCGK